MKSSNLKKMLSYGYNLFLKSIDNIYNLLSKGIKVFSIGIDPENHEKLSEPAKIKERMIVYHSFIYILL